MNNPPTGEPGADCRSTGCIPAGRHRLRERTEKGADFLAAAAGQHARRHCGRPDRHAGRRRRRQARAGAEAATAVGTHHTVAEGLAAVRDADARCRVAAATG